MSLVVADLRERARLLDASLDRLDAYWRGGFQPLPVQSPRIPVWVAGNWPNREPWEEAGATWILTSIEPQPPETEIRQIIQAGPDSS